MTDPVTQENFVAWNEAMLAKFDLEAFHRHPSRIVRFVEQSRINAIMRLLRCSPHHTVLEVGCGAGHLLARVPSKHRFGVDISASILEKARVRLGDAVELTPAPGEALPYADGSFDRVYCSEVLEHVLDPAPVLAEIHRVVRPEGIVVVSVRNEGWINLAKQVVFRTGWFGRWVMGAGQGGYQMAERMDDEWHRRAFNTAMLKEFVRPLFRIERIEYAPSILAPLRIVAQLSRSTTNLPGV